MKRLNAAGTPPTEFMTTEEAAAYLRLGRRAFFARVVHSPTPRLRVGTRVIWRRTDLEAWAAQQLVPGDAPGAVLAGRGRGRKNKSAQ
jgi:excisionase family DNA binding protein